MAARVYTHPEELGDPPELSFDNPCLTCGKSSWQHKGEGFDHEWTGLSHEEIMAPERAWEDSLKQWARDNGQGELAGEEVRWHRGDGYARYVVFTEKPLGLIHIPTGDAWNVEAPFLRGLRLSDIREEVRRSRAINKLFGRAS